MTSVLGHLTGSDFTPEFKQWMYPPPDRLFSADIKTEVSDVSNMLCTIGRRKHADSK